MHTREYLRPDQLAKVLKLSIRQLYRIGERITIKNKTMMIVPEGVRQMDKDDELLTVKDIAKLFKVSKSTIYRWLYEKELEAVKLTDSYKSTIRIFKSSLDNFINKAKRRI